MPFRYGYQYPKYNRQFELEDQIQNKNLVQYESYSAFCLAECVQNNMIDYQASKVRYQYELFNFKTNQIKFTLNNIILSTAYKNIQNLQILSLFLIQIYKISSRHMEHNSQSQDWNSEEQQVEAISITISSLSRQPGVFQDQSSPISFQKNIEEVVEEDFRKVVNKASQSPIYKREISRILRKFRYKSGPKKQVQNLILLKKLLSQYQDDQNILENIMEKIDLVLILKTTFKLQTKLQVKKQIFDILLLVTQQTDTQIYEHVVKNNIGTVNKVVKYMFDSPEKIFNKLALAISHRLLLEQQKVPFIKYFFKKKMLTRVFQIIKEQKIQHHSKILAGIIYETTNHLTDFCYSKPSHIYFCEKQMINILQFLIEGFKKQTLDFRDLNIIKNNCLQLFEYYNSKELVLKHKKIFVQLLDLSKNFLEEFKLMFKLVLHFNLLTCSEIEPFLKIYEFILNNQYQETICIDTNILILIVNQERALTQKVLQIFQRILTRFLEMLDDRQLQDNKLNLFQNLVKSNKKILLDKNYQQIAERCAEMFNLPQAKRPDRVMSFIVERFNPILLNFHIKKMGKNLSSTQIHQIVERYYKKFGMNNVSRILAATKK